MTEEKHLWTKEQVKSLNEYQKFRVYHPFTCGNPECREDLIATVDGWICPKCDYKQYWAHDFMLDGSHKEHMSDFHKILNGLPV